MNIPALIAAIAFLVLMISLSVALLVLAFEARKTLQKVNTEIDKMAQITDLLLGPTKDLLTFIGKFNGYIKEPIQMLFSRSRETSVIGLLLSAIAKWLRK
jgi:hypothetical protein